MDVGLYQVRNAAAADQDAWYGGRKSGSGGKTQNFLPISRSPAQTTQPDGILICSHLKQRSISACLRRQPFCLHPSCSRLGHTERKNSAKLQGFGFYHPFFAYCTIGDFFKFV